ncbi:hypothetical protein ASG29_00910 [Sphingomonas sp. Leaf412]|uniref:HD-GYP domain-containing protein n=1 Tax=Sphingomonas sp. Leaf412 TaxID=1736370 RepID=UPI0006FFBF2B|nr:HD-GYP domain-containing protein [Sphingomonas sp. Leaf412]KQT34754.1 hypothetical protein ASG29_00910 [Sphingomonas sp. Leaf412]
MLHRIAVTDVRLGMYISSVDCSWFNNPFWRSRFLLREPADLERLRQSGIAMVTIDDARGIGLAPAPEAGPAAAAAAPAAAPLVVERRAAGRPRRRRMDEMERARETVARSRAAVERMFGEARLGHAVQMTAVVPLVDEIAASIERDRSAILNVTRLKNKNEYTYLHSVAVCALMINLARQLGLPEYEVQQAGVAGLLHDIGKMATPIEVLEKPGRLDDAERRIIEDHPSAGYRLLSDSADISAIALDVCLHHHERMDGRGYPDGLTGDQLSIHARMGAICDVYDAITSCRPYKQPWSPAMALQKMLSWEGHFDPRILAAFVAGIGIFPIDGLVRLHSNRLGIVLHADDDRPTAPPVRIFYDVMTSSFLPARDVATHNGEGGDPIIRAEHAEGWFGDSWPGIVADLHAGRAVDGRGVIAPSAAERAA